MKPFLKNAWYMAAWADEVGEGFLTRTLLGEPMVMYRTAEGRIALLRDECPHRFAPLSKGQRFGDGVQCGYHGLRFNADGVCTGGFYKGTGTSKIRVPSYLTVERDTIVWMWNGDPALAKLEDIPRFEYLVDAGYKTVNGLSMVKANYQLLTDNLMDLSHIEFLHPAFNGVLENGRHTTKTEGATIHSNWWATDVPPTGAIQMWWPQSGGSIDHWLDMRWNAPATMLLHVGATHPGKPRSDGLFQPSVHILTPETESRTHYFWNAGMPRDNHLDMKEIGRLFALSFDHEDAPMIEAVQARMRGRDLLEMEPVLLRTDLGAVLARRALQKLLGEQAG
jgi:phenylpropionate dioxygenase-like ring-hydroxylating dioxygenase large terminal subunit